VNYIKPSKLLECDGNLVRVTNMYTTRRDTSLSDNMVSLFISNPLKPTVAIWVHSVPDRVTPLFVIFDIRALTLGAERKSAWVSKITNDGLTRSGTGCFIAVPMWQQWASKG